MLERLHVFLERRGACLRLVHGRVEVAVNGFVVDERAHGTLAAVNLAGDGLQISGGFVDVADRDLGRINSVFRGFQHLAGFSRHIPVVERRPTFNRVAVAHALGLQRAERNGKIFGAEQSLGFDRRD